jgi:hypothetical protein
MKGNTNYNSFDVECNNHTSSSSEYDKQNREKSTFDGSSSSVK